MDSLAVSGEYWRALDARAVSQGHEGLLHDLGSNLMNDVSHIHDAQQSYLGCSKRSRRVLTIIRMSLMPVVNLSNSGRVAGFCMVDRALCAGEKPST